MGGCTLVLRDGVSQLAVVVCSPLIIRHIVGSNVWPQDTVEHLRFILGLFEGNSTVLTGKPPLARFLAVVLFFHPQNYSVSYLISRDREVTSHEHTGMCAIWYPIMIFSLGAEKQRILNFWLHERNSKFLSLEQPRRKELDAQRIVAE